MAQLTYIKGDATNPIGEGRKVICHINNDINAWGAGFVIALSRKWTQPEKAYHDWFKADRLYTASLAEMPPSETKVEPPHAPFQLGEVQFVKVEENIVVCNMIGQSNIRIVNELQPIRYDALSKCLLSVAKFCHKHKATMHGPKFGSGLSGGNWTIIECLIKQYIVNNNINATIYEFE